MAGVPGHPELVLWDIYRDRVGREVGRGFRTGGYQAPPSLGFSRQEHYCLVL